MDNLEKFIENNRESFDNEEPSIEHLENFKSKLNTKNKVIIKRSFIFKAAAILIITAITSLIAIKSYEINYKNDTNKQMTLSDVSVEYKEIESFYKNDVHIKIEELKSLTCKVEESQKTMIFDEISVLNGVYNNLQKELLSNPNDKRIIDAMINNYQIRVELLDKVITHLKKNC